MLHVSSSVCCNVIAELHQCLLQTADDNAELNDLDIVNIVKQNFYIDDCLSSVPREEDITDAYNQQTGLISRSRFNLSKWANNNKKVLNRIAFEKGFASAIRMNNKLIFYVRC